MEPRPVSCFSMPMDQPALQRLFEWLSPSPEEAQKKYEAIRGKLITIFLSRGSAVPEALADETINRVLLGCDEIADANREDPTPYFYSVANLVYLEHLKKRGAPPPPSRQTR